ncbi:MAG: glycosyltransferase [Pseudomonadales bacterium]|nr:glycosyltransferase [Pseudomonadales bacterium]
MKSDEPLVSFVTPVYNGAEFIQECIDSVLLQSYDNWEYIIVDNYSDDGTTEILAAYADTDKRFRVFRNESLLSVLENHNVALQKMSADSKYCKIVQADDFLYPTCVEKMVGVAECNDNVAIVGSLTKWGVEIKSTGLSLSSEVFSGKEVCRRTLLSEIYTFWSPSALLLRSDVVRERGLFYSPAELHGDVQAYYEILEDRDFGFVHEVLTFVRVHENSVTSKEAKPLNRLIASNLDHFVRYGPVYLTADEYKSGMSKKITQYYKFLSRSWLGGRDEQFWNFHQNVLEHAAQPLSQIKLAVNVAISFVTKPLNSCRQIASRVGFKMVRRKFERRWRRHWMALSHKRFVGVAASWFAGWFMPPLYGRLGLSGMNKKGYFSPSAEIAHPNFKSGEHCYLGERVLIYLDNSGGTVRLGDRVHLHRENTIQTGSEGSVEIGSDTHIQPRCQFSAYHGAIKIGERVEIAPSCAFYPYDHGMDLDMRITDQPTFSRGGINVEDDVWLGFGVIVLDNVNIGRGAVIAAGAVVTSNIPANAIAAGVPAKIVGQRKSAATLKPVDG